MKIEIVNHINARAKVLLISLCLCLPSNGFAQTKPGNIDDSLLPLIEKIKEKSRKTRVLIQSEYQLKYKRTIESQAKKETTTQVYEMYCLNNGESFCRSVLIEKNGQAISSSKIQKSRKIAAQDLVRQNENYLRKDDPLTYGIFINKVWVDPTIYLENCRITSSSIVNTEERPTYCVKLNDCRIVDSFKEWKQYVSFMPATKAEIWIDQKDSSVTKMNVYAGNEVSSDIEQNKPIVKMEAVRMPEGYWFVKKIKIETTNKEIFPNFNDNWEYEFFDYKRVNVNVEVK